ncbi:PTS sugar transporter subunit IIB [Micrococcales bacterium 31B]|nr:PTS sugar transporter subunit IIB [Micrococcales bacterium 31B]
MTSDAAPQQKPGAAQTVVVVCGSGAATSFVVAKKVTEYLAGQGIDAHVVPVKVADLPAYESAAVIVATAEVPSSVTTPIVAGLPLLTGIGEQQVLDAVAAHLRETAE